MKTLRYIGMALVASTLTFGLASCGDDDDDTTDPGTETTDDDAPTGTEPVEIKEMATLAKDVFVPGSEWGSTLFTSGDLPQSTERATLTASSTSIASGGFVNLTCSEAFNVAYVFVDGMNGFYRSLNTDLVSRDYKTHTMKLHNLTAETVKVGIVAETNGGSTTDTVYVSVGAYNGKVARIELNMAGATIAEGGDVSVTADVYPATAVNKTLQWASSDETVATVDQNGKVTATGVGSAKITAQATDGSRTTARMILTTYSTKKEITQLSIEPATLTLKMYKSTTLSEQWGPADANNPVFSWRSSNEDVATVNQDGIVTAKDEGTCTITICALDGSGKTATCNVTVTSNHEYVDLGLPSGTLWASTNVGAGEQTAVGSFWAWGDTKGWKDDTFEWRDYWWCKSVQVGPSYDFNYRYYMTKYTFTATDVYRADGKSVLEADDDPATARWGEHWCSPSFTQFEELVDNCDWSWVDYGGTNGYIVQSRTNDGYIFLPAGGFYGNHGLAQNNLLGEYWTRNLLCREWSKGQTYAASFYLKEKKKGIEQNERYYGFNIRPVRAQ